MAKAAGHSWGQILGNLVEAAIKLHFSRFAQEVGLYIDKQGSRPVRGKKKLVRWQDSKGHYHNLDIVLEKDGTDTKIGAPFAFVESAWRRYTRHSKNKAQEIQGAVLPILEQWSHDAPYHAAVLVGEFTPDSIAQLKSHGFQVIYILYENVIKVFDPVFKKAGVDGRYDEDTTEADLQAKTNAWKALTDRQRQGVLENIAKIIAADGEMKKFLGTLRTVLVRKITCIRVLPLHGSPVDCTSLEEAIKFIEAYKTEPANRPFVRYEVQIRYDNGDKVDGQFSTKEDALDFFKRFPMVGTEKLAT